LAFSQPIIANLPTDFQPRFDGVNLGACRFEGENS
jgi:hypothetical protein